MKRHNIILGFDINVNKLLGTYGKIRLKRKKRGGLGCC
jgi:hypothetical protein